MNKRLAVVILNWNGLGDTKEVLGSVSRLKLTGLSASCVLVDNRSTDGSVDYFRKYKLPNMEFKLLENRKNLGFAAGNNVGIKYALEKGADMLLVVNNDVILDKNLLKEMVKVLEENRAAVVSPMIYFAKGFEFHKERYKNSQLGKVIWYAGGLIDWDNVYGATRGVDEVDIGQYNGECETDFATGTCMLVTKKAIGEVGYFDEKYYLYYEDTDLSVRLKKAGYKVMFAPDAKIWHKVSQSSGIGSELNDYFTTRNRMFFGLKYAKLRTKFALIKESINLLFKGRKWQKIGIRDFYLFKFGKGSWK